MTKIWHIMAFEQSSMRSKMIGVFFNQVIKPMFFGGEKLEGDALKEKEDPMNEALDNLVKLHEKYEG